MKTIYKIVLTGGPCAGKTTALSILPEYFEKLGWHVVVIQETVTTLFSSGITLNKLENMAFQELVMKHQIAKEDDYSEFAGRMSGADKVLIICDRGVFDAKAYMRSDEFNQTLCKFGMKEAMAFGRYDAVFHLVTTADGAEKFYGNETNAVRSESLEQARIADIATQNAWVGHPHMRIIRNNGTFNDKMRELINEISIVIGEPESLEIERKFLIHKPDEELLLSMPECRRVEILQTYLISSDGVERRIRQRGFDDEWSYTLTEKIDTDSAGTRIEREKRIDKDEYLRLLMQMDPNLGQVRKTRYCILQREHGQYLEIDFFPDSDLALLEIETSSMESKVVFPEFVRTVLEVTDDLNYRNLAIAKRGGKLSLD